MRLRSLALAAAAVTSLVAVATPASPAHAIDGCTYKQTNAPGFQAQCSTKAPGTQFRVGIKCKYRDTYKWSPWVPQGLGKYAGVGCAAWEGPLLRGVLDFR
jgi:hypothetical protein